MQKKQRLLQQSKSDVKKISCNCCIESVINYFIFLFSLTSNCSLSQVVKLVERPDALTSRITLVLSFPSGKEGGLFAPVYFKAMGHELVVKWPKPLVEWTCTLKLAYCVYGTLQKLPPKILRICRMHEMI